MSIPESSPSVQGIHTVRVCLPDGTAHEVNTPAGCGLRYAARIAGALAGWLAVDEWESASRFVPVGVKKVRRKLLKDHPDLDLQHCTVEVLCSLEGARDRHGYECDVRYRVGESVPELLRSIRDEAKETGWRTDPPHVIRLPRLRPVHAN